MNRHKQSKLDKTRHLHIAPTIEMAVFNRLKTELAEIAPGLLVEFINAYLLDAPQMVASIKNATVESDGETLNRMAHTLKANSARLGAVTCSKLCQELEMMGAQHRFTAAKEVVQLLEAEYERVEACLRQEMRIDPTITPP